MFTPNHLHLLVKGSFAKPPKSEDQLNDWFRKLVNTVRMVVVAGPTSTYVDEPGNEGITGTVTLATSHSSMHVWDAESPPLFQFDIYSCCEFEVDEVLKCLDDFDMTSCSWMHIDRNEDEFRIIATGKLEVVA